MQWRVACVAALVALAFSLSACNTAQQGLAAGQRSTVAFDSIDGPPPAVFQRLVRKLNEEAEARQVPVVTREGFAPYRIRGYLALGVQKRRAIVSWVWDVYDAQAGRALRLSGEERAGPVGRDAWAAVNDEVLARVARSGMEQLALYFSNPDVGSPAREARPIAVAQDDFAPESHGITRSPSEARQPASTSAPAQRPAMRGGRVAAADPQR